MTYFFLLLCVAPSQNQATTAEAVIARYIDAKGGKAALEKVKNYVIKGEVFSDGKKLYDFESYQAPNSYLAIDRFPGGLERRNGTDGKTAWSIDVRGTATVLTGQRARDYIRHNSTLHEAPEWKSRFKKIEYAGQRQVGDSKLHELVFLAGDGTKVKRFFEVDTGLFVREEQELPDAKRTKVVSIISDYRKQNGSLVSRRRMIHYGSDFTIDFKVKSVEANVIKDMSVFAIPKSMSKLLKKPRKQRTAT